MSVEPSPAPHLQIPRLLSLVKPYRRAVAVGLGLVLVATVLGLAQPLLAGRIVDQAATTTSVTGFALLLVALFVLQTLVETGGRYLLERTGEGVVVGQRQALTRHLLRLRIPVLAQHRIGDLISRAGTDAAALRDGITRSLVDITVGILTVVGAVALMLFIDPLLFLVVLGAFVGASVGVLVVLRRIGAAAQQAQSAVGAFSADLERSLSALRTVRMHRAEESETLRVEASARAAHDAGVRGARLTATAQPAVQLAASGSFLLVLIIGGIRVASGDLPLGDLVTVLLYATYLVMPLGNLLEGMTALQRAAAALYRVDEGLALSTEPVEERPRPLYPKHPSAPVLSFDDVYFSYTSDCAVLDGVSFDIPAGSRTAVVGASGAGKSTLLALACRFYEPDRGTISFLGHQVDTLTRAESRQLLSLVEQDSPVLHGTLRENLCLAHDFDAKEISSVLHEVNLDTLVERLPNGLDTSVGEHGASLSGGERQRLALARALLTRPALLLLDEPTASLDAHNESVIVRALERLAETTAVLTVAHRLSTVRTADRALVMESGRIVAEGTHEELLRTSDHYRILLGAPDTEVPPLSRK